MTRDEETLLIRLLQEADADTLRQYLTLTCREQINENLTRLYFEAVYGEDSGYLWIHFETSSRTLIAAEMNVNFPTMIGLNRSPLELRILADHVIDTLSEDEVVVK